jgi:hypothetical protein
MKKVAVCEEIAKKIEEANTLKVRNAASVHLKMTAFEYQFRQAHDWAAMTGVGVLASDGKISFDEAVKKRFVYYFDVLDVMAERASARPKANTDKMTMGAGDSSSSSSSGSDREEGEDDVCKATDVTNPVETTEEVATRPDIDDSTVNYPSPDDEDSDRSSVKASPPTFESPPSKSLSLPDTTATSRLTAPEAGKGNDKTPTPRTVGTNNKRKVSLPTTTNARGEPTKKAKRESGTKRKKRKKSPKKGTGSAIRPLEIEDEDSDWETSLLGLKREEAAMTLEIRREESQLAQEKWKAQKQQQSLQYKFDLMVKYKQLMDQGFDNHQILKMIPDMRPIMDKANMPFHVQLSQSQADLQASQEAAVAADLQH